MYVLGNPVLSRLFQTQRLKLNHKGLFYPNKKGNGIGYDIFITNDVKKILSLIDINFDDVDNMDENVFFPIVANSPHFKLHRFIEDISEGECRQLASMALYLKSEPKPQYTTVYKNITLDNLFDFFKEENFNEIYTKTVYNLENYSLIKRKFNGQVILKNVPDYDRRKLSTTIPHFNHSYFPNNIERDFFILSSSEKDLVNEFLKVTND